MIAKAAALSDDQIARGMLEKWTRFESLNGPARQPPSLAASPP